MARNSLCVVYLLIAISSAHSASFFYRTGREIVVPTIDEVKEIVSELKKDEAVIVEEIPAVAPIAAESVEVIAPVAAVVKSVPESVVPVVETVQPVVENNVVAVDTVVPAVASEVISEEARSKPNPAIRLDTLEVIPPGDLKSDKVQTVAETVKIAAVQAIEKQNEEIEKDKPVEAIAPVVEVKEVKVADVKSEIKQDAIPEVKSEVKPEVKLEVQPEVKSEAKSEVPVVPVEKKVEIVADVKLSEPVVAAVKEETVVPAVAIEKVEESQRSADPVPDPVAVPSKPDVVKEPVEKVEEIVLKEKSDSVVEKEEPQPVANSPERQDAGAGGQPNPIQSLTSTFAQIQTQISTAFNNLIPPPFRPQQSDAPAQAAGGLNTNEIVPNAAIPTQAAPAPSTQSPNLVQNIQNALSNIFPRPTPNPAAPNDAVQTPSQTGTRGDQVAQAAGAQPVPTTSPPNIIANIANNVQNAINQITSIFPRPTATPALAPAPAPALAAANPGPNIVKGTRGDGEEEVEVVQNIDIVNDKVDLAKKVQ